MIVLSDLSLRRGTKALIKHANLSIHNGHKVGLTGANGTGKSSLFALIRGELTVDEGSLKLSKAWVIAHVKQETPSTNESILDYTLQGDAEYTVLKAKMENASDTVLAELLGRFETIDGYTAESRGSRLLAGLGFSTNDLKKPVKTFSGGWRMRLNLAQALMCRSDLLLLDEPTNHLDMETVLWLQSWLQRYEGTLLIISHDREFLDAITTHIAHIENGGIKLYKGNYSSFETIRSEQLAQQQANYERQQREVAHIQSFIDRFRAQATKAKQAQSRIKALERMQLSAPVMADTAFYFSFKTPDKLPERLFSATNVSLGYTDDQLILDNIKIQIMPGDRMGLVGPNGAGKSTLIKYIANEIPAKTGDVWQAHYLKIGYFAQHQLDQLVANESPLQHLRHLDNKEREQVLRDFLGGFGFRGERVDTAISIFSGGEKSRLALALLIYQKPNLLLLDEPTNHLDLEMRQALARALQTFEGAMIVVSHDRYLLKNVVDQLLVVDNGTLIEFDGDLDDYSQWSLKQRNLKAANKPNVNTQTLSNTSVGVVSKKRVSTSSKEQRRLQAEKRKQLQPLKKIMDQYEKRVEQLTKQQNKLDVLLADSTIYNDENKAKLIDVLNDKRTIDKQLAEFEEQWIEATEAYDEAEMKCN